MITAVCCWLAAFSLWCSSRLDRRSLPEASKIHHRNSRTRNGRKFPDTDDRLPNGKSRSDAIAQSEHKKALEEADQLVDMARNLKSQLDKAGSYVVPVNAVRTTEDIEKLAKKIRGRLKM